MKYILIDIKKNDMFTDEFAAKEDAIKKGQDKWDGLSDHDKKQRDEFCVIESINPDEDAIDHFDGDIIKDWKAMNEFERFLSDNGFTIRFISDKFQIPYRTVQNWKSGVRQCPSYILRMIKRIIELEK